MNKVDFILVIIILIPTYLGFKKGFLKSVFSLVGIIVGLILATMFNSSLVPIVKLFIHDNRIINIVSFIIILVIVYFIIVFIAVRIARINQVTKTLDKISGLFLGFVKGIIAASIICLIFISLNIFSENTMKSSFIFERIKFIPDLLYKYISTAINDGSLENEFKKLIPFDTLKEDK